MVSVAVPVHGGLLQLRSGRDDGDGQISAHDPALPDGPSAVLRSSATNPEKLIFNINHYYPLFQVLTKQKKTL